LEPALQGGAAPERETAVWGGYGSDAQGNYPGALPQSDRSNQEPPGEPGNFGGRATFAASQAIP